MFFDRDQNARRQRQIAYRNELKQQIDLKNSKIYQNQQGPNPNKPETFSLLKNIEIEQQNRKKRQQNFYSDLQKQIQFEQSQKIKKKQQRIKQQLEEEQKIKKQQEVLRQRAQMERIKEQNKKAPPKNQTYPSNTNNNQLPSDNPKTKTNNTNLQSNNNFMAPNTKRTQSESNPLNPNNNFYSRLKTSQSQRFQNELPLETLQSSNQNKFAFGGLPTYVNRVENQHFNFLPTKKYMDTYFQQLLGQKRRFQQEASSISQLNKILYQERSRAGKIQSRGLGELKKLQAMLDEKGANYMAGYKNNFRNSPSLNDFDSLRKLTIPSFDNSRLSSDNSGWRKLD